MKKAVPSIVGEWRIVEMEQWDRDYMDMEVQAFIRFRKDARGISSSAWFPDPSIVARP
jgi:hypothetical protein